MTYYRPVFRKKKCLCADSNSEWLYNTTAVSRTAICVHQAAFNIIQLQQNIDILANTYHTNHN